MRMMGCRSGRMYHSFDKTTHRCTGCGRWQAGFAPKKEHVKPRCECQICERQQATDKDGTLGHHGYTRPGYGWIQGDCMGEGHKPYPMTDALEKYLASVKGYLARCEDSLAHLPQVNELSHKYTIGKFRERKEVVVMITRGSEYHYNAEIGTTFPAFETLENQERRELEYQIENARREIIRVEKRITNAPKVVVPS